MALFERGRAKTGGRLSGTRNKISKALLEALAADFEAHGIEAIRITRRERPADYLKVIASILPKEFEITDSRLQDLSDDELDAFIDLAKRQLSNSANARSGEAETTH